jgi:peptidylprolyl isomerase
VERNYIVIGAILSTALLMALAGGVMLRGLSDPSTKIATPAPIAPTTTPAKPPLTITPPKTTSKDVFPPVQSGPREVPSTPEPVEEGKYIVTASGLKYFDHEVGTGASPATGNKVALDYTGWLANGTRFDSSLERDKPVTITIGKGEVMDGWDEGVLSMKVGGKRHLVIPPDIAFGKKGRPPVVPPNETLTFEMHLVGVE